METKAKIPSFYHPAREIIQQLMASENSFYFFKPDPADEASPEYLQANPRPMCFFTIQEKLDQCEYKYPEEFVTDVRQIWQSAKLTQSSSHPMFKASEQLSRKFEMLLTSLPKTVSNTAKQSDMQRLIELRFGRYRMNKETHQ